MRTSENAGWEWLRKAEKQVPDRTLLHWHRIENSCDKGTPDIEGCYVRSFVIETKSVPRRKRGTIGTELTEYQSMFLEARCKAGGLAWIFIQVGGDKRYLIWGAHASELLAPITEQRLNELSVKGLRTPLDVLEAVSTLRFYGSDVPMNDHDHDHGPEITRYIKPGQIIRIMKDGCLITEIVYVIMPGVNGHTIPGGRDSATARENLAASGFAEEEL